jgi:hypothetical protein
VSTQIAPIVRLRCPAAAAPVRIPQRGGQLNFRSILLQSVEIKAIENNDFDIWLPLWKGYQRFYEVAQPDERNVRHWMGPDAFESRTRSHGHYGKQTLRCVRGRTALVSRPFASLHGDEQVSVVPRKAAVHAFLANDRSWPIVRVQLG